MSSQVLYYDQFGLLYRKSILQCPEPEYWTTDYAEKGRVYQEMKQRVQQQEQLALRYFQKDTPILDIGCGFGRQAVMLARQGFTVTGTDTSPVFISIAQELISTHQLPGTFVEGKLNATILNGKTFSQVMLLDVLEHIPPAQRSTFINELELATTKDAVVILSLPQVKKRWRSQLNNRIRKAITQFIPYFLNREEHPYPIPGKETILKMISSKFELVEDVQTEETGYYILQKIRYTRYLIFIQEKVERFQCTVSRRAADLPFFSGDAVAFHQFSSDTKGSDILNGSYDRTQVFYLSFNGML
jgi:cyclopropane fatty-acyl-phospholipid synthase-like methyltransferase